MGVCRLKFNILIFEDIELMKEKQRKDFLKILIDVFREIYDIVIKISCY